MPTHASTIFVGGAQAHANTRQAGARKRMPTHNESCMSDRHDTDVRHVHAMEGDGGKWRGVEVQVVEEGWREVEGSNDSIG